MSEQINEPTHRFAGVEEVEAACPDCDLDFFAEPDSLEPLGVSVLCPECGQSLYVDLYDEED